MKFKRKKNKNYNEDKVSTRSVASPSNYVGTRGAGGKKGFGEQPWPDNENWEVLSEPNKDLWGASPWLIARKPDKTGRQNSKTLKDYLKSIKYIEYNNAK